MQCRPDVEHRRRGDFTLYRSGHFVGWSDVDRFEKRTADLSYRGGVQPGVGSFVSGSRVAFPPVTRQQIIQRYRDRIDPAHKRYAEFIALDIRSRTLVEVSCDPAGLSNYFQPDSDLPLHRLMGEFSTEYDPLASVKTLTERLDQQQPDWLLPGQTPCASVSTNPVTTSQTEWAEALLALDQLVVEGFRPTFLRHVAQSRGADPDKQWGSIKLLTEVS